MKIIDVWKTNLEDSMLILTKLLKFYNYVAMDTEFPGIISQSFNFKLSKTENSYQTLKTNVDLMKVIQIGFTLADEKGTFPESRSCWQFNFYFDIRKDLFAQDSIDLLVKSGVNFYNHKKKGIKMENFAFFLIKSGLVLNKKIKWISFHSAYDFGYLIKILTNNYLPSQKNQFFKLLQIFFPCSFDMKYLGTCSIYLQGGLNKLAEKFNVPRFGPVHQAGSDSLLTLNVFFKLRNEIFNGEIGEKFEGVLYGLGSVDPKKNIIISNEIEDDFLESISAIFSQN